MIISETHRFICFQPWKVASSTLYKRLKKFDSGKIQQEDHYNKTLGSITHRHIILQDYLKLPESNNDFFKFCFVKNIYDRIYSGFLQRHHRLTTDKVYTQSSEEYIKELEAINKGFDSFLDYIYKLYIKTGAIRGNFLYEYVYYNNVNMMNFIGYAERFEADFANVCNILKLNNIDQINANVRSQPKPECNPHNMAHTDYKHLSQYSKNAIKIVNECYARDFEYFGYQQLDPEDFSGTVTSEPSSFQCSQDGL